MYQEKHISKIIFFSSAQVMPYTTKYTQSINEWVLLKPNWESGRMEFVVKLNKICLSTSLSSVLAKKVAADS